MKVLLKYMLRMNRSLAFTLVMLIFIGMNSCSDNKSNYTCASEIVVPQFLDSISEVAKKESAYPYYTDRLLYQTKNQFEATNNIKGMPFHRAYSSLLDYTLMLVLKGENLKAINEIEAFLEKYKLTGTFTNTTAAAYRILALANIRQAEQDNCIAHSGNSACIIPLQGDGIHKKNKSTKKAFDIYEKLLAFNPADYQSIWFYNITGMALEKHPEDMEEAFVLPLEAYGSADNFPRFENVASSKGLHNHNHAGGGALEDFNNDGLLDIFSSSYGLSDPTNIYANKNNSFVSKSDQSVIGDLRGGLNHIHGDFNNDGLVDVFIARGAWLSNNGHIPNSLLLNNGDFCFSDETKQSGLWSEHPTGSVAAADIDLDGDLDLFEGNESTQDKNTSYLHINDGKANFTKSPSLSKPLGYVKGAVWGDINNDRYPDLFISRYGQANLLLLNTTGTTGEISFQEIGETAGISDPKYSFTCWFWDYNQDGKDDIFVSAYDNTNAHLICDNIVKEMKGEAHSEAFPKVYENQGDNTFKDVTEELGLNKLLYTMGGNFGDITNNGYPDFYCGTGEFNIWATIPNRMFVYRNGTYEEVTRAGGFGQIQKGHGVTFGDYDNDGDLDIFHQVGGAVESDVFQDMLFENPGNSNNWIGIKLKGTRANSSAIGAKIRFYVSKGEENTSFCQSVSTGGSFGANPLKIHQGLAEYRKIDSVVVDWPCLDSLSVSKAYNLEINKNYEWKQDSIPYSIN